MTSAFLWGLFAASSLLVGALLTFWFRISNKMLGLIMAFGSGVLISAVAFELAHESAELSHGSGIATLGLFAGALVFFARDWISLPEIGSSVTWAGKIENLSVPHMVASSAYRSPWDSCSTASRSPSSSDSVYWEGTRLAWPC